MLKNSLCYALALCVLCSPVFAQTDEIEAEETEMELLEQTILSKECSVIGLLQQKYGNVVAEKNDDSKIKLSLAIPGEDVEKMLTMVVAENWFPCSLVIKNINLQNTFVSLNISKEKNDSPRRFRVLQKLAAPGVLTWKGSVLDAKEAYVTSIETEFGEDFVVKGETLKSNLVFTRLTPRISSIGPDKENLDSERFASKKDFDRSKIFTRESYYDNDTGINGQPFFERGTYKEDPVVGRYMMFILRCRW